MLSTKTGPGGRGAGPVSALRGAVRRAFLTDEESLQRRRPALRELPRAAGGYDWYAAHGLAFPSEEALVRHRRTANEAGGVWGLFIRPDTPAQ